MLPKGFVLKKDRKRMEKEAQAISIEELIEKERANLDTSKLTKVTLETFVAWKKKKLKCMEYYFVITVFRYVTRRTKQGM